MKLSDIILKEEKNCGCGQTPCKTYGIDEASGGKSRQTLIKLVHDIGADRFSEIITDLKDENIQDQIVAAFNIYTDKKGTEWIKPDLLKETLDDDVWRKLDDLRDEYDDDYVIQSIIKAMSTDDANLYLDAIMRDHGFGDGGGPIPKMRRER
jgi:hypothetical protein